MLLHVDYYKHINDSCQYWSLTTVVFNKNGCVIYNLKNKVETYVLFSLVYDEHDNYVMGYYFYRMCEILIKTKLSGGNWMLRWHEYFKKHEGE